MMNKILHLVLKRKYWERIYNGTKTVEYRDFSKYWQKRFEGKNFTHIRFQLAYSKNPPTMLVEYKGYTIGKEYELKLGKIIEVNYE